MSTAASAAAQFPRLSALAPVGPQASTSTTAFSRLGALQGGAGAPNGLTLIPVVGAPISGSAAGVFLSPTSADDRKRGIIGTIAHEIAQDVKGAGKVAAATALSPFALLGAEVPVTWEDVSGRDIQGAAMVGATVLSGGLAGMAGRTALGGVAAKSVLGRAGLTAGIEATGGTLYGTFRERQAGETRLESIAKEAAIFATFGAAGSMLHSAYRATVGGMIAGARDVQARKALADAATRMHSEVAAQEVAGITLLNPESGARASVRRDSAGKVVATRYDRRRVLETKAFPDFNAALTSVAADGYLQEIGPFRTRLLKSADFVDDATLRLIEEKGGDIPAALGPLRIASYRAVQEAAKALREADGAIAHLAAEIVAPATTFGEVALAASTRRSLAAEMGLSAQQLGKMNDADLLRELAMRGLVSPESLQAGVDQREMLRQLFINDAIPEGADIVVSRTRDAMMTSVSTPFRIAQRHPEVAPLVKNADERFAATERYLEKDHEILFELRTTTSKEAQRAGAEIIDNSVYAADGSLRDVAAAQQAARQAAAATNNPEIARFVDLATGLLEEKRSRLVAGRMLSGEGRVGYFPIVNVGEWKVEATRRVEGKLVTEFQGFAASQEEARQRLASLRAGDASVVGGSVSPKSMWWEGDALVGMNPQQFAAARKAVMEAASESVSFEEATQAVAGVARLAVPRKSAGNLRQRVLGVRDFSADPTEALEIYVNTVERAIQFRDFEAYATRAIEAIPSNKPRLRRWAEQYRDDVLGRPRDSEKAFQGLMNYFAELSGGRVEVPERALATYTAGLRRWESFSRLGGFWSGAVNLTQVAINTFPVLGAKWTAKGLEVLDPRQFHAITKTLRDAGVDLETYVPFSEAGATPVFDTVRGALKDQRYLDAAQRIALFAFNGAEKINRLATAWGAYNKALAEGMGKDGAIEFARQTVLRTQFNYRLSNMPEVLRGPVGSTLLQFKSYVINEVEFIGSLKGAELARFGAALWATGGIAVMLNMPGTDIADAATGAFFDRKLSEALKLSADDALSRATIFGLPGIAANADVSDYVGVGSLADITRGIFGPGVADMQALGVFFRDAAVDVAANGTVSDDTKNTFLQRVMPSALRRATRGAAIAETGEVRNPYTGKLLYKPEARLRAALQTGFGAPDIRMSQERAADDIVRRARDRYVRTHTAYAKEAAQAYRDGDLPEMQAILGEAIAAGHPIDGRTIRYWVRELGRGADERRLRRTPKALREELMELYEVSGRATRPEGISR